VRYEQDLSRKYSEYKAVSAGLFFSFSLCVWIFVLTVLRVRFSNNNNNNYNYDSAWIQRASDARSTNAIIAAAATRINQLSAQISIAAFAHHLLLLL